MVDVALTQGGRTCVRCVVTLGDPEHHVEPLLSANPVTPLMSVEPPEHIEPIGPGHPAAAINNLARGCDIRPDLTRRAPNPVRRCSRSGCDPKTGRWTCCSP